MKLKTLKRWLLAAAFYNILFGIYSGIFPQHYFEFAHMPVNPLPQLWQCIGMIVGVYGLGYAIAARDPLRHWPIVLVGAVGKIFGPLGFLIGILQGTLPWSFGWILLTNDLLWWPSFYCLLLAAARHHDFSISSVKKWISDLREVLR